VYNLRQRQTVANKTQVFDENRGSNTPSVTGLGKADPAHVSEHITYSQAARLARVALSRLSGLDPSTPGSQ
jgi:hypothetical protein